MAPEFQNEEDEITYLATQVLVRIQRLSQDEQIRYEKEYRKFHPKDDVQLVILMVAKNLAQLEARFLTNTMSEIVTPEIQNRINAVYYYVLKIVKKGRAGPKRTNEWNKIKKPFYPELKEEQKKLNEEATRRLERDLKKILNPSIPKEAPEIKKFIGKPVQTYFAGIMEDVDRQ